MKSEQRGTNELRTGLPRRGDPTQDASRRYVEAQKDAIDITDRKTIEKALRESEQRYRGLFESSLDGIFFADMKGHIRLANAAYQEMLGYSLEELSGMTYQQLTPQPWPEMELAVVRERTLKHGYADECEDVYIRKDGTVFPISLRVWLTRNADGEPTGVWGIVHDITKSKLAELTIRESERRYRDLADSLGEIVFEADVKGKVTYANRVFLNEYNLSEKDIEDGLDIFSFVAPQNRDAAKVRFARILQNGDMGGYEYALLKPDGSVYPALVHTTKVVIGEETVGARGVVVDLTERKKAEDALRESEQRFATTLASIGDAVIATDDGGRVTFMNAVAEQLTGWTEGKDRGRHVDEVFNIINEITRQKAESPVARVLTEGLAVGLANHTSLLSKDGREIPIDDSGSPIKDRDGATTGVVIVFRDVSERRKKDAEISHLASFPELHPSPILELDASGNITYANAAATRFFPDLQENGSRNPAFSQLVEEYQKGERESLNKDIRIGDSWYEMALSQVPQARSYRVYVRDITAYKLAAERLLQKTRQLQDANKELQQFAYVASHDLREPLRMIASFSQSLEKKYRDRLDKTATEYIGFIVDGASRMQALIDDLLVYSRVGTRGVPFEPVSMNKLLKDTLDNLNASIVETGARVTYDPLPVIPADSAQMIQLLQNLIANAIKFRRKGEAPVVHVSVSEKPNEWVFSVADNGIGIDPEMFGRLFVLFSRLQGRDEYPGTGVGLAVAKRIAERHGGQIWVESQPWKGSTFYFSIPKVALKEAHDEP